MRRSALALVAVTTALAGRAAADDARSPAAAPDVRAVVEPGVRRGLTQAHATVRPFLSVLGGAGGAIADLGVAHYFAGIPLRLSLELSPLALAIESDGPGAVGHFRLGAAYASEYVEIGLSAGSRVQNYGGAGISMAGFLRLGTLDGLKLTLTYDDVFKRNTYSGKLGIALSNILASLDVPVSARVRLFAEGGVSADKWLFGSLGLRHRLRGDGGAGTWIVSGSFGLAWVLDRPDCRYPDTGWCTESSFY
jgi:hypothetical protein